METPPADDELFARHVDVEYPNGWLVDLINRFGAQGGFDVLLELFRSSELHLSLCYVHALLKPFAYCSEFLTKSTAQKYFYPMHIIILEAFEEISDQEMTHVHTKVFRALIQYLQSLRARLSNSYDKVLLELASRRVISRINEVLGLVEGGENLSQIEILYDKLEKKEEARKYLASSIRNEQKRNAELVEKLAITTEKNRALEERVKDLENKYETDLKELPLLQETIQNLTTKFNEIQSIFQKCSLDIQGVKKSDPPTFPTTSSPSTSKSVKAKKPSFGPSQQEQTSVNHDNEEENVASSTKQQMVKPETSVPSSIFIDPSGAYLEIFEENKDDLAIKILEKLSVHHLLNARLASKKWNQLVIPILHEKSILEFSYTKQQNVHPLTSDLNLEKSLRRTLCQFNKVLQSARTIAEKSLLNDSAFSWSLPCLRFSFDLSSLSKMEFNKGALYKFFTSHLNNFSSLKQLTLTESDEYLNGKMQQEHHEIILKILKGACNKIEHLDISGLYSTSNRSGIEIESSPDRYFSKLESMKTDGNLFALNGWILSSAPVLKNVEMTDYRNVEGLKVFEKHVCLDLIQRLEIKFRSTVSFSQLAAVQQLPLSFQLPNLKVLKMCTIDKTEEEIKRDSSTSATVKISETEMRSITVRILKSVESSLEYLECGYVPFLVPAIEYPELPKLHTLKYVQDAGLGHKGFLGYSSKFDGKFQKLTTVILDLNYVSDDWFRFFCKGGSLPSVQSLEISNESFLRKESDQNLGRIAASFPNLRKFKTCDPQKIHTQSCFLQFIWKHLKGLKSLELTLGKKAASHGPALNLDSIITGLSLSTCAMIYDSERTNFSHSKTKIKEPSITHLKDLKRFTLHLDDLSSLSCQNKEFYPLLSKVAGQFVAALMPSLRIKIFVPSPLLEKARETSIGPFVTFSGKD